MPPTSEIVKQLVMSFFEERCFADVIDSCRYLIRGEIEVRDTAAFFGDTDAAQ